MKRSLRSWLWRVPVEEEVDEELAFHIEMRTRELVERGVDPASAREQALARAGDLRRLKRTCIDLGRKREREMRLTRWIEEFGGDVRFAVRQLRMAPGFAAVAVLTLALGIGANSAIFALVDAVLLRPLPFHEPDRLVAIWERTGQNARSVASPLNMHDWNARSRSFEAVAGFIPSVGAMVMSGRDGTSETVSRQWVTAGIFDVLGVQPIAGRIFHREDNEQRRNLVMLSEGFWRRRYGGDPSVIGRDERLDGRPFTIVGVMPGTFTLLGDTDMWAMRWYPLNVPQLRAAYAVQTVGRLKPGVTIEQAQAEIAMVAARLAREFPRTNDGRTAFVEPLHEVLIGGELRTTSILFLGVVGFVLLICCANVANLLLARAATRARELAIRSAIGAARGRVMRQLVTESLVLAVIGGALGIAVGAAILRAAPSYLPDGLLPPMVTLAFDARVVLFCAAASLLVGVLFGLAPAWQATGLPAAQVMAAADSRTSTGRGARVRNLLVVGEVATAVLLLFGASLLLRTLLAVNGVDRGYQAGGAMTMLLDPLGDEYPTPAALLRFYDEVEQEVRRVPGVRDVAYSTTLPLGAADFGPMSFEVAGAAAVAPGERPTAAYQIVSGGYFDALGIPLVVGRIFTTADVAGTPAVCIVSEAFVQRHLGGREPIGVRLALRPAQSPQAEPIVREIVGVARQVRARPDETEAVAQIYVPLAQQPVDDVYLVAVPDAAETTGLAPAVRRAIGRVDKAQLVSVHSVTSLDDIAREATGRYRFRAVLVVTFAALALVLAMVGVFGVLGYAVQQRAHEFGVRRALGASAGSVLALVVGSAGRLVLTGVGIGLVLAAALARSIAAFLFGIPALDPVTFGIVGAVLAVTAVIAVAGPALRALRVDPITAFRQD